MKEKFRLNGLVLAVSACLMAGCGGGGGGGSSSADTPAGPAETPASVNVSLPVQVIDGYLADIDVCIVKENDPSLGCDESFGTAKTLQKDGQSSPARKSSSQALLTAAMSGSRR